MKMPLIAFRVKDTEHFGIPSCYPDLQHATVSIASELVRLNIPPASVEFVISGEFDTLSGYANAPTSSEVPRGTVKDLIDQFAKSGVFAASKDGLRSKIARPEGYKRNKSAKKNCAVTRATTPRPQQD